MQVLRLWEYSLHYRLSSDFLHSNHLSDSISDARVVIKDASGTCIIEASDKIPRVIHNCPYDKEDIVTITYKKGSPDIRGHNPKS